MDVAGNFPCVLRLQNPGIANADDLGGIEQVMQGDAQAIDRAIHGLEDSVIDRQPTLLRSKRRRSRSYLHFIPVVRNGTQ